MEDETALHFRTRDIRLPEYLVCHVVDRFEKGDSAYGVHERPISPEYYISRNAAKRYSNLYKVGSLDLLNDDKGFKTCRVERRIGFVYVGSEGSWYTPRLPEASE